MSLSLRLDPNLVPADGGSDPGKGKVRRETEGVFFFYQGLPWSYEKSDLVNPTFLLQWTKSHRI